MSQAVPIYASLQPDSYILQHQRPTQNTTLILLGIITVIVVCIVGFLVYINYRKKNALNDVQSSVTTTSNLQIPTTAATAATTTTTQSQNEAVVDDRVSNQNANTDLYHQTPPTQPTPASINPTPPTQSTPVLSRDFATIDSRNNDNVNTPSFTPRYNESTNRQQINKNYNNSRTQYNRPQQQQQARTEHIISNGSVYAPSINDNNTPPTNTTAEQKSERLYPVLEPPPPPIQPYQPSRTHPSVESREQTSSASTMPIASTPITRIQLLNEQQQKQQQQQAALNEQQQRQQQQAALNEQQQRQHQQAALNEQQQRQQQQQAALKQPPKIPSSTVYDAYTADETSDIMSTLNIPTFDRKRAEHPDYTIPPINGPYIDIDNYRRNCIRVKVADADMLQRYRTKRESPASTEYMKEWVDDGATMQALLENMLKATHFVIYQLYVSRRNSVEVESTTIILDDFVDRLLDRLDKCDLSKDILWGEKNTSWYTFGIMIPVFLGHYLMMRSPKQEQRITKFILEYIPEPARFTKNKRERHYEGCTLTPWLLAHKLNGTLAVAIKSPAYIEARKQLFPAIVPTPNKNGLHRDLTFYAYSSSVSFNSLQEQVGPRARPIYFIDVSLHGQPTNIAAYDTVTSMICHPHINKGNYGMFGRRSNDECDLRTSAIKNGIFVFPTGGILISKTATATESTYFTVRAQRPNVAFYVTDQHHSRFALHWVQQRKFSQRNDPVEEFSERAPGLFTYTNAFIDLTPKETNKFKLYYPEDAKSGVFKYKNYGILYQTYKIREFGKYEIRELIVVDSNTNTITITVQATNNDSSTPLRYTDQLLNVHMIQPKDTKTFINTMRGPQNITVNSIDNASLNFPIRIDNTQIMITETGKVFLLMDNMTPKIVAFYSLEETENITTKYNNETLTFKFDEAQNQWVR
ncbi:11K [Phenacoccus solenopsis nudivirus]|nr:11K [Phenacoccus solenopsis nudivirus]